ncbi:metal ABC transporter solute-binding protein, Zn/Mn family [Thiolapillus sp.]
MKRGYVHIPVMLVFLLFFATSPASSSEDQLRVVSSIKPVHSILSGLLKGVQEPELLVGIGKTPYGYTLTAKQEQSLKAADLIVWVGPELEKFLAKPLGKSPEDPRILTLLDRPELKILPRRQDDNSRDPHLWLDSRNAILLIDLLTRELILRDPARSHLYKRNRNALYSKVAKLDRQLEYGYRGLQGGVVLAYFDTQQYFEQAYALKVAGVLAPSPEIPVSGEQLLNERALLAENRYACLLTEANIPMPELPLLTNGLAVDVVELDSFGSKLQPGEDLYLELMKSNTRLIKQCIQKKAISEEAPEAGMEAAGIRKIGGKFMLTDHHGKMVTEKDLLGKFQLIYFGYTFCPDVCPSSLSVISTALKRLGEKAKRIQPYFITVDPQRDTQEIMANYVAYFHKDMIGLRGSQAMTDRIIKNYNLVVEKVQEEGAGPDDYIMDHTASVFLIAPDGTFITKFAHGITPTQLVEKLNEYVR